MKPLTQERARELFDYRASDGALIRKKDFMGSKAGRVIGTLDSGGYMLSMIDRVFYRNHQIVWVWHHGYFPENQLDHINRERADNRIENLREVSQACNNRNTGNFSHNKSGVKGVYLNRKQRGWSAQIKISQTMYNLGCFVDFIEAVCHRLAAEQFENWAGCDDCSPAYQYVKKHIPTIK